MRWFAGIALGYVALMVIAIGAIQFLARANREPADEFRSPTGAYTLGIDRDAPVPAIFGIHGTAQGDLEVVDSDRWVMDSEHIPDIDGVTEIQRERYKVDFHYRDGSRTYSGSLDLAQ